MSLTVSIASTPVTVLEMSPKVGDKINQRSAFTFKVRDDTGTALYNKGQPVTVVDSVLGTIYSGFIGTAIANNLTPNAVNVWTITTTDNVWLADKRSSNALYTNQYSGVIVGDQIQSVLSQEGVTGNFAMDYNHQETDWAAGGATLTNVVATANAGDGNFGDGDLELALAGSITTHTDTTTTNFNTGTLTNMSSANNQLQLAGWSGLQFVGKANSGYGNNLYSYWEIWAGAYTIVSGDALVYSVWINSSSPQMMVAVDGVCSDGTILKDFTSGGNPLWDQNEIPCTPKSDLSGFANDQWYTRTIDLTALAGKSLQHFTLTFEGDTQGLYTAYFHDINILHGVTNHLTIYSGSGYSPGGVPTSSQLGYVTINNGYSDVSITPVFVYAQSGSWVSAANSAAGAGIYQSSQVFWEVQNTSIVNGVSVTTNSTANSPPSNTTLMVSSSWDGGITYQPLQNEFDTIPAMIAGQTLSGLSILMEVEMSITGKDPTISPIVTDVTWTIYPSYSMSKSDILQGYLATGDWSGGGTHSNTKYGSAMLSGLGYVAGLIPASSQRTWDDGIFSSQTLYGTMSQGQHIRNAQFTLLCDNGPGECRSKFDFAGQWADFIAQIDITVPNHQASSLFINVGLVYRSTGWQNNNNSYAYAAYLQQDTSSTQLVLAKGSNSSSGGGSFTNLGNYTFPTQLTDGDVHTFKIVISGSSHSLYLDDVLYLNVTDATYTAAGYLGARLYNNSAGHWETYFDNFGVIASNGVYAPGSYTGPDWTSNSITLGTFTVGQSLIQWNQAASSGDFVSVLAKVNAGSYVACVNGQPIPGLAAATVLSSATLHIQIELQGASAIDVPVIEGLSLYVMPQFSATGTWTSPALSLAAVGRAGVSLVNWNANLPASTTLVAKTSVDAGSSFQTIAAAGNAVGNITVEPDSNVDLYTADTSANYTSTFRTGGAVVTSATFDTTNSRLLLTGGTNALYISNAPAAIGDLEMIVDMDESDAGGFVWHFIDGSNFYEVVIADGTSASSPNTITLFRVLSNVRTQVAQATSIGFVRGTYRRFRMTMIGAVIVVLMDGVQQLTYTDGTPVGAGKCGLRNTTSAKVSRYYQLRIQPYGEDVTAISVKLRLILTSTTPLATPQVLDSSVFVSDGSIGAGVFVPTASYQDTVCSVNIDDQNKQSNYWWNILPSGQFIFRKQDATPAPWILQSVSDPTAANIQVANLTMEDSGDLYRNRQKLTGVQTTITQPQLFKGDGTSTTWALTYPVATNTVPTITLNGVPQTAGVKGIDSGKNFYYQAGSTSIDEDGAGSILSPLDQLLVTSTGSYTTTVTRNNTGGFPGTVSQSDYAAIDGTSGIVEAVEDVSALNMDVATAQQYGDQLLQRYGIIGRILGFMTLKSGLAVGQQLPVFVSVFQMQNAQLLITSVDITETMGASLQYWYSIVAVEGPALDHWTKVFGNSLN